MIALAQLIVVAQHAFAANHISQTVLEAVQRATHWLRKLPNDDLDKACVRHAAFTEKQFRPHVAYDSNE
jgi:hypothetical protein